ncbi:hypothetical protein BDV32DRAFT_149126 [Aspergillus pseudonomiae]|uniref:Uncharacterized protein n=1 Tax=Aspergillus pseudonomiae TaxID=1506151 RepID=A0A5N7DIQ3_9EURO|nr:uncharacterized protein BDV37DRAFT_280933 [Aspergillus pseudonomiae]KAB8260692.1 hypothetical protein BDV32DRAFT_149126 [Aspergillus pseudonomiae]KAE8406336.1 hypothetical protein BDV37DRAFT_280933 [Aspergillus pseudonomiae]
MSDTSLSPNAGSLHHAFSDGLGHNPTNPLGQNNLGLLASNLNMWPLPPNSAIMPGNPFHYPPWQPLHEDFVAPQSNIYYDLGMETNLRMPTSFQSDEVATAGYPYGHSSSNTTITPVVMPVEHQPRGVQQETRAKHIDESGKNYRPVQRCKWEGCTSTKIFNREADLVRHVRTIHIAPRSYRCNVGGCFRSFNRGDNLKEHMLRVHDCDY